MVTTVSDDGERLQPGLPGQSHHIVLVCARAAVPIRIRDLTDTDARDKLGSGGELTARTGVSIS